MKALQAQVNEEDKELMRKLLSAGHIEHKYAVRLRTVLLRMQGVGNWNKGLTDLEVQTGDNAGEIKYKFSATDPEAESYLLYCAPGNINSAELIIERILQRGC